MAGFSNYYENEILDQALRNEAAPAVVVPYVSLHSSDPGETGVNEITGGSYIRASGHFITAAAGATNNDFTLTFTNMPAVNLLSGVGIWDASGAGAGNFIGGGLLSPAKVINSGDTFQITSGNLDVTLD